LYYTASGIVTLKQVSGLKLLKYNYINEHIVVKVIYELFECNYCIFQYTVIKSQECMYNFYYYVFIFTELYFSNFRPLACFNVTIPDAV